MTHRCVREGCGPLRSKRRGGRPGHLPVVSPPYFPALQPWAQLLSEVPSHICGEEVEALESIRERL